MGKSATKRANGKATGKILEPTTASKTRRNSGEVIITFGTLTFAYSLEQAYSQLRDNPAQEMEKSTPQFLRTSVPVPADPNANTNIHNFRYNTPNLLLDCSNTQKHKPNTTAVHKFLKVPPATKEWQKVVRKQKTIARENKRCFFCGKLGHTQRFCWKKIKCFGCGRYGHKHAKCHYKPQKTPPKITANQRTQNTPKQPNLIHQSPTWNSSMVGHHLATLSVPPRQELNEHNAYLDTVGLVVLIRGAPTPDFPLTHGC